jgi:Fur family ferric uptake transcriptional regulator
MDKKSNFNKEVEEEMKSFETLLKNEGLKVTNQRMLVAETIFGLHSHFTADSLLDLFKDKREEVSKATIYRILTIMVRGKLLIEHDFGKDYKFYEHIIGHEHHDHIICMDCGRIVEFLEPEIEALQEKAASENGFKIKGHSLNIYGNCENLANCEYYQKAKKRKDV